MVQLPQIAMKVFVLGQSHNLLLQNIVFKKVLSILYFSCCLEFSSEVLDNPQMHFCLVQVFFEVWRTDF